jgi:hypothetical protein
MADFSTVQTEFKHHYAIREKKMFSISNYVRQMSLASFCYPKKIQTLTLFILQACMFSTGLISVVQLIQAHANEEKKIVKFQLENNNGYGEN